MALPQLPYVVLVRTPEGSTSVYGPFDAEPDAIRWRDAVRPKVRPTVEFTVLPIGRPHPADYTSPRRVTR